MRVRPERPLECDLGPHVARHDLLPRIYVGDDGDDDHVEEETGDERGVDRLREVARDRSRSRASSDPLATDSKPVMKYGTICRTRKIDSSAPADPGCENNGCMFAGVPRAKPSSVKIANVASRPNVITSWNTPARLDAAVVDDGDQRGQREADREPRRVDRRAVDDVEL